MIHFVHMAVKSLSIFGKFPTFGYWCGAKKDFLYRMRVLGWSNIPWGCHLVRSWSTAGLWPELVIPGAQNRGLAVLGTVAMTTIISLGKNNWTLFCILSLKLGSAALLVSSAHLATSMFSFVYCLHCFFFPKVRQNIFLWKSMFEWFKKSKRSYIMK